jgi:HD-like signal output (HDOD) protein
MSTAVATEPQTTHAIRDLVKKVTTIATLPEVTARIISTVEDPKSSASQLHKIVSHDPALVARILKVVNSAFYGLPGQVGSIERAIVLLGLNAIKNIAVAASLGQLFRGSRLSAEFTAKDLWAHCVAVGLAARDMAQHTKLPIAEEAFLAGMIHDVGILISLQTSPEQLRSVCDRASAQVQQNDGTVPPLSFCELERQIIGVDHQQLGMALAEHWKFPRPCQLVVGFHHDPSSLGQPHQVLVGLVHVADTLCCQTRHGFPLTAAGQKLDDFDLNSLHLTLEAVEATRSRLDQLIANASNFLA